MPEENYSEKETYDNEYPRPTGFVSRAVKFEDGCSQQTRERPGKSCSHKK